MSVPMGSVSRYVRERRKQLRAFGVDAAVESFTAHVPCGSCTACCHAPQLGPRDSGEGLEVEVREGERWVRAQPDGRCVHLVAGKCTVYDKRPSICRVFDCRDAVVASFMPEDSDLRAAVLRWQPRINTAEDVTLRRVISERTRNLMSNGKSPAAAMAAAILGAKA